MRQNTEVNDRKNGEIIINKFIESVDREDGGIDWLII